MTNQAPKPDSERKGRNFAMAFAAAQMGLLVAAGLIGGLWLDHKFGTTPWIGFVGIVAGFASGVRLLVRLVRSNQ